MKSLLEQDFYVISLFVKRLLLLQGMCVSKGGKEWGGVGGERQIERFYNSFLPRVESFSDISLAAHRDGDPDA